MASGLHPLHRLWRVLPKRARRAVLLRAALLAAPRPDRPPPPAAAGLAVAGELDRASGLGQAARLVLDGLAALAIPAWPMRPGGDVPPPGVPLLLVGTAPGAALQLLRLGRDRVRGRLVIGYWFWELPTLPPSWRAASGCVHCIWAPSRFSAAALAPLARCVRPVPLPVALRPPVASARDRASFGIAPGAFVTLVVFSLASSFARKNPLAAVAAHRLAFGERPDRLLFIHVTNTTHFPDDFAQLRAAVGPNARVHDAALSRADLAALMQCCDVALSLHRSEGFGLVPAEAMLLGKPVVATEWSATTEFMDADGAALVPARLVPAQDPRGVFEAPGAVWAEADVTVAASWLQRLAGDRDLARAIGERGRRAVQSRLGTDALAQAVRALGAAR